MQPPFYFVLRAYVHELKKAREAAGLTLAEVSARTGMALESLSRSKPAPRLIQHGRLWARMQPL
jgi:transcriptional regulator with XRE-family HTH domain